MLNCSDWGFWQLFTAANRTGANARLSVCLLCNSRKDQTHLIDCTSSQAVVLQRRRCSLCNAPVNTLY